jgi:hypothetical protein
MDRTVNDRSAAIPYITTAGKHPHTVQCTWDGVGTENIIIEHRANCVTPFLHSTFKASNDAHLHYLVSSQLSRAAVDVTTVDTAAGRCTVRPPSTTRDCVAILRYAALVFAHGAKFVALDQK